MRDALSIFDQIVSFSGNKITYQGVIANLNVLDYDYYFQITDAFLASDYIKSLLIFDKILKNGFDGHHFITGLASHFRDLLVCKDEGTAQLFEVGDTIKAKYDAQCQLCSVDFLFDALKITTDCDLNFKNAKEKRLHVEFALMGLCRILIEKKK